VLVTGIRPPKDLGEESFDPTDVGSLDPRHKGEDDGGWDPLLYPNQFQVVFSYLRF
jgi:hypothetical protein